MNAIESEKAKWGLQVPRVIRFLPQSRQDFKVLLLVVDVKQRIPDRQATNERALLPGT